MWQNNVKLHQSKLYCHEKTVKYEMPQRKKTLFVITAGQKIGKKPVTSFSQAHITGIKTFFYFYCQKRNPMENLQVQP